MSLSAFLYAKEMGKLNFSVLNWKLTKIIKINDLELKYLLFANLSWKKLYGFKKNCPPPLFKKITPKEFFKICTKFA